MFKKILWYLGFFTAPIIIATLASMNVENPLFFDWIKNILYWLLLCTPVYLMISYWITPTGSTIFQHIDNYFSMVPFIYISLAFIAANLLFILVESLSVLSLQTSLETGLKFLLGFVVPHTLSALFALTWANNLELR